jgi:hypothetical protein
MTALNSGGPSKNPGIGRSTTVLNVAYKRTWCETFVTNSPWRHKKNETQRKGRPVQNDVAVEIPKNRIPTATCKSLRKKRFGFRTFCTGPAAIHLLFNSKGNSYDATKNAFLV